MTSSPPPRGIVRAASFAAAAAVLLTVAACGQANGNKPASPPLEPPPAKVTVTRVAVHEVQQWDTFNGRIAAQESVEIRPRVTGYIDRVSFREGQAVRKGQVLFTIDARPYQAALANAQAQLQRARAAAALARTQDQRARDLLVDRAISTEEADTRAATLAQALANVQAAEAAVSSAQLELSFTEVRAPINGTASRALLTPGNLAQANQSVLSTVVSDNPVYVYFDADEQSLLRHRQTTPAEAGAPSRVVPVRVGLASDAGFPHAGEANFFDNRLDPQTGTISVRATLRNDSGLFTPGMFARVQMQDRTPFQAVLIDDKAVLTDQDRKYAFVVGADNRAERRELTLGRLHEGQRVVTAGLQAGDLLVVAGLQRIHYPGMPLAPQESGQAASTEAQPAAASASASRQ